MCFGYQNYCSSGPSEQKVDIKTEAGNKGVAEGELQSRAAANINCYHDGRLCGTYEEQRVK